MLNNKNIQKNKILKNNYINFKILRIVFNNFFKIINNF